jgi:hypothetical protein
VDVPQHGNKLMRQLLSYYYYQREVMKIIRSIPLSFIFVSTSKLFTGYLAYRISKKKRIPYYLDLRDLFGENLREFIKIPLLNVIVSKFVQFAFEKPMLLKAKHININSEGFSKNIPYEFNGTTSFFPNGIDDEFSCWQQNPELKLSKKQVCYAGNIGEGQGLHKIIPQLAKELESTHHFTIIGEGSAKAKLISKIKELSLSNVEIIAPMKRIGLLDYYKNAHYLFLHLNDFKSFEKVLPSKIFEYGSGNIPVLAGVNGYAKQFLLDELKENIFIFNPCDVKAISSYLKTDSYRLIQRSGFISKFSRKEITDKMSDSIIHVMNSSDAKT